MDHLPNEIITNILSRLPVKSLLICRSVSKTWHSLIDQPSFADIHFINTATHRNPILTFLSIPHSGNGQPFIVEDLDQYGTIKYLGIDISPEKECPFVVGYSNGLFCVTSCNGVFRPEDSDCSIFVCNPATREYIKLPDITRPNLNNIVDSSFGFGFDPSTKVFKVVQIFGWGHRHRGPVVHMEIHLYVSGSDSWKRITNLPDHPINGHSSAIFLNGSLHWLVYLSTVHIVSFDIGLETFGSVSTPRSHVSYLQGCYSDYQVRLGLLNGCLCLVDSTSDNNGFGAEIHEIWVMKDYSVSESWTKEFVIRNPMNNIYFSHLNPLSFRNNGELLFICSSEYLVSCSIEKEIVTTLQCCFDDKCPHSRFPAYPYQEMFPYIGNLISIKRLCNQP